MGQLVTIVGRPNVGKSTLFNRLTAKKTAIVDSTSGVTRDRHYGSCEWNGKVFNVVDTGGYMKGGDDVLQEAISSQVEIAIEEADQILFLVDVNVGITDLDEQITRILRGCDKPVFLVCNKVDNNDRILETNDFYKLGLGSVYAVSSINGSGTGELLDDVVATIPEEEEEPDTVEMPAIAVVGRPNVGKSSLVNVLLGEERNIVTPVAGTTRDAVDSVFNAFGHHIRLVDTAGLRKKGKVVDNLEFYSVMRSIRAVEYSDVCLLLIEAPEGMTAQDVNVFRLAVRNNKGIVILLNKWDLVKGDNSKANALIESVKQKTEPFTDIPVLITSVKEKKRLLKALDVAMEVYHNRMQKIKTRELNDFFLPLIEKTPPPSAKGKYVKIKFVTQLPTHAPSFAFFCNLPQYIKEPYKRFLENRLREKFQLTGVPVRMFFRKK